jgi:hypothetical protein
MSALLTYLQAAYHGGVRSSGSDTMARRSILIEQCPNPVGDRVSDPEDLTPHPMPHPFVFAFFFFFFLGGLNTMASSLSPSGSRKKTA